MALIFTSLSAFHIFVFHVFTVMESSIIILNSFNGNFYFSNPALNNNPVRILVMQYKTLHLSLPLRMRRVNVTMKMSL